MAGKRAGQGWQRAAWAAALILLLAVLSLSPYLLQSSEMVRLRNAWLLIDEPTPDFRFTPANMPVDFLTEQAAPEPLFVAAVQALKLQELPTDWERAVRISEHLLARVNYDTGGNQTDLKSSYRDVTERGQGYCADFVRAFTALSNAAGMSTRMWAFSFDGFGGHGHVWVELWNRERGRLELLDVFDNAYFTETGSDLPLSALDFRAAMLERPGKLRMHKIAALAPLAYVHPEKAWAYYRRGLPEWYLWWGNNPHSYDQAVLVRALMPVSYALSQLGGMAQGLFPGLRVLATPDNQRQLQSLRALKLHLQLVAAALVMAGAGLLVSVLAWRQALARAAAVGLADGTTDPSA